jgi:segregation and condensation protein A
MSLRRWGFIFLLDSLGLLQSREFWRIQMYRVRLQNFEGPLDLLLFFIKRDELNIYDIPIAKITKEFWEYVQLIQMLDLEVAGDFILMASTLMQIKVRLLLAKPDDGEEEEEDPRAELVRRLLEYKRYKELATSFSEMEAVQSDYFYREFFKGDERGESDEEEFSVLQDVTIYQLIAAFKYALDSLPKKIYHDVERINVTIEEQLEYILKFFGRRKRYTFLELVQSMTEKIRIVVTFIALLELIKNRRINVKQSDVFHDIWIYRQ